MGLRTIAFVLLFLGCSCGALGVPLLGILGYVAHYIIGPERQWWVAPLRQFEIRYSLTLAVATAIGIALNFGKLRYGATLLTSQEKALLGFVGFAWLLRAFSEPTVFYTVVDHPALKLTKVAVFCLMLTHVVTNVRSLKILLWTLVISTFILGIEAYSAPRSTFEHGRLEGIGGVDFGEANFLAAFIGGMLPLAGVLFLESRWLGKLLAGGCGVFCVNTIVLTRSRGAVVGMALGVVVAIFLAPKGYRTKIVAGLLVAGLGGLYLADPGFLARLNTLGPNTGDVDRSAQSRLETWALSVDMLKDHPLGIGPGNFFQVAGEYDQRYQGRDSHNTYARCFTELGIPGFALFLGLILHSIVMLKRTMRKAYKLPPKCQAQIILPSYGLAVGLCMMLGAGLTVTLLYTEALWWFLMLPVCLERAVDNLASDFESEANMLSEEMETDWPVDAAGVSTIPIGPPDGIES